MTFKYTAPFTLKAGKRTLKAVAVTRYLETCPGIDFYARTIVLCYFERHATCQCEVFAVKYSPSLTVKNNTFCNTEKKFVYNMKKIRKLITTFEHELKMAFVSIMK